MSQSSRLATILFSHTFQYGKKRIKGNKIWGLSTLAKELSVAARIIQSSSKELSTLVADRV